MSVLATEDVNKKELIPEDFRFPIIGREEIDGVNAWKMVFLVALQVLLIIYKRCANFGCTLYMPEQEI